MAKKALVLAALLVVVVALAAAPEPTHAVCNMSNDEFKTCQPAAATTNPTPNPSQDCCAALRKADLECLCSYKDSPWLKVYNVDPNRAMALPGKCGLTTPANC